jgi:hypothetical protein
VHDRPRSEARVPLAVAAAVDGGTASEGKGRPSIAFVLLAVVADEAIGEALGVEVGNACFLAREVLLEVGQRLGDTTAPVVFSNLSSRLMFFLAENGGFHARLK